MRDAIEGMDDGKRKKGRGMELFDSIKEHKSKQGGSIRMNGEGLTCLEKPAAFGGTAMLMMITQWIVSSLDVDHLKTIRTD